MNKTNTNIKRNTKYRQSYHITPQQNWMNDPNGLVYWNNEYHVFFQHEPNKTSPGLMHWGHVRSKDLIHWEHLPHALIPEEEYEKDGCWSGSAVDNQGTLSLFYTGHKEVDPELESVKQVQCLAVSTDGVNFEKSKHNPVIDSFPKEGSAHFRDPKVWKHKDEWYMVVGTRKGNVGKVVLYRSLDLVSWDYVGVMLERNGNQGSMWECPDVFPLGEKHILMLSPIGIEEEGYRYQNHQNTVYFVGDLDYDTGQFHPESFQELDLGFDFYAAQTFSDSMDRRLMLGWMDMWESPIPTIKEGWAGSMTVPRVLSLSSDNQLIMSPVSELEKLRENHWGAHHLEWSNGHILPVGGESLEVEMMLKFREECEFAIAVRTSEEIDEQTIIKLDAYNQLITLDRSKSGEGVSGVRYANFSLREQETVSLRIFIDHSSVELFLNGGELVMSARIYPDPSSTNIKLIGSEESIEIPLINVWKLKSIWNHN
ncbi:glycoside hydrolase family 32 protein [Halobacillus sp. H74]|uniref:glycoside hydrolase family 32 protein n=1 Tax=Halobacillus sp. H74 TaxID=3457436 RepID=UPI003FCEE4A8